MTSHEEMQELLGAYALDAVDADERVLVEAHLAHCPRCRDELRGHREVVGLLGDEGQEAPAGLWDRVVGGIREAETYPPSGAAREGGGRPMPDLAVVPGSGGQGGGQRRGVSPTSRRVLAVVAAAALVAVAVLGVRVARLQDRTNHLSDQMTSVVNGPQPTLAVVHRALAEAGAKMVELRSPNGGGAQLEAVILPSGTGYLYSSRLPPLPPSRTYQLWGVVGHQDISYGLVGGAPSAVTVFRAGGGLEALAVTAEEASGVVTPTHSPLIVGAVS
jgi:hypothetical protein